MSIQLSIICYLDWIRPLTKWHKSATILSSSCRSITQSLAALMLLLGIGLTANGAFAHIPGNAAAHPTTPSRPHAAFTPGDLVIYRVGDGTTGSLASTGSPVFLDEYTTLGVLVQSIPVP